MQYVPDGEPCPKPGHEGKPTRLGHLPGAGLYSQCDQCIEDFFAWQSANLRAGREARAARVAAGEDAGPVPGAKPATTPPARPQLTLL